jgi:hypothetical protein
MKETEALERRNETGMRLTATGVLDQIKAIQDVMAAAMHEGEHYGKIPGCGDKPALLKAGAEKLGLMFRLAPAFEVIPADLPNGHREYRVTCTLTHIQTGDVWGQGVGSCSSMESKYRYRPSTRKCPACGVEAIIKGKAEYGGGWVCFKKKGGCGAKYSDNAMEIVNQPEGRTENPDIADTYNTILKMAKKRAHVDAIITATGASDIFTQDIEEPLLDDNGKVPVPEPSHKSIPNEPEKPSKPRNVAGKEKMQPLTDEQRKRGEKEFRLGEYIRAFCDVTGSKPTPEERQNMADKFAALTGGKKLLADLTDEELDGILASKEVAKFEGTWTQNQEGV